MTTNTLWGMAVADTSRAVFLSYASEDAGAAQRICEALRSAGIEVWFDQSELRGGDAWDHKIRHQIRDCTLFLPLISASTQSRAEGYFRLEWRLAAQRTHLMGRQRPFLVPVCVDATPERDADVPDAFLEVQWTRLPHGEVPTEFIALVRRLIAPESTPVAAAASAATLPPAAAPPAPAIAQPTRQLPEPPTAPARRSAALWTLGIALVLAALAVSILVPQWQRREHARNVLLPAIEQGLANSPHSNAQLLDTALEAERALPKDRTLAKLWPLIATSLMIDTQPAGAGVYWKDYGTPEDAWHFAGLTPLKDVRVPRNLLRVEIRKEGYQTIELVSPRPWNPRNRDGRDVPRLTLDRAGSLPTNMVRIPASAATMYLVRLQQYGGVEVPEFLADRYEVTNRQYKAFVDAGGYANPAYWRFPVVDDGTEIPFAAARARFTDRTGRPGPATWEVGSYPAGLAEHPVTGVSWYEAAAYAAWAGKQLPTVYHWAQMADTWHAEYLLRFSNFSGKVTTAAGSLPGLSSYGVYDIAGNVREWALNAAGNAGERYVLGGGYTDPGYAFTSAIAQPSLDRSATNGFRCIRELPGAAAKAALTQPLSMAFRDYAHEQPVDDRTFAQFARQFVYDRVPLDARIDNVIDTDAWKLEAVSVNAAYNGERLPIYVYLPRDGRPPYQSVVLFPGSDAVWLSRFDPHWIEAYRDLTFIIKSGRALVFPVYKSTFERQDNLRSILQNESVAYKDHVVMWVKDLGRTLDYLEARKDMRADRIAYLGISWGGFLGGILPAVEKRVRVVVLNVGGMDMGRALPEVDQIDYLPRVRQPVLVLNGEYDNYFPVETAQKPFYKFLGTAASDKKMIIYPSGHLVPRVEFIKETLSWLDKYLGPVQAGGQSGGP